MPRQVERQLDAGREFRKTLVDTELEVERAILMPKHDRGGNRGLPGMQGHDFALAGLGQASCGAPDEAQIAFALPKRGAAFTLPATGFQREKNLNRLGDLLGRAGDRKPHLTMLGEAVALAPQLLQLLGAERVTQDVVGFAPGIKTGAQMRMQDDWLQAVLPQRQREGFHRRTVERDIAQD